MADELLKAGIYMRLSHDDEKQGESMSIERQRILLRAFVEERGGTVAGEYVDDGYSGTNFSRPAVRRLLDDAQAGKIDTVIVKDLSRFGRNYIQVGQYIDYIFPAYGIRFIAVTDNVDTADRSCAAMDMMPIMNVFNEWHAANTSKKIRAVFQSGQRAGKYTGWNYPYGYRAGNDENRTAVVDGEAARVVRRIFHMRAAGDSYGAIARSLTDDGIPNPATHFTRLDGNKAARRCSPYWNPKTVMGIVNDPTYLGKTVQHRTERVSYKNRKVTKVSENERIVKEDSHQAIVTEEEWAAARAAGGALRGRADGARKVHPLSGLLVCADCGKKLKYKSSKSGAGYFVCRTYADLGKRYCTSHALSEKSIESVLLRDIRSMLRTAPPDREKAKRKFLREHERHAVQNALSDTELLKKHKKRLAELDLLVKAAFEEKVLKNTSEAVYENLCLQYREERENLQNAVKELENRGSDENITAEAEEYADRLIRYSECEILTREMCLRLIDRIEVGERDSAGNRRLKIYYKFAEGNIRP